MMHLYYDHQTFTLQRYGGISRYFRELIPRVAAAGVETDVWMGAYINQYGLEHVSQPNLRIRGFPVPLIRRTGFLRQAIGAIGMRCCLPRKRQTVYHPTYYNPRWLDGPNPSVVTVYDLIYWRAPAAFDPAILRQEKARIQACVARATALIAISQSTASDLIELLGVAPARISVIHLGVSQEDVAASDHCIIPVKKPYLLYVGMRYDYKNFRALRDAYDSTPELHHHFSLVCCGGGPLTAAERSTRGETIALEANEADLARLYRGAAAFVYPTRYEGFGIPLLEAMRYGTPVVAVRGSSLTEVGGDAVCWAEDHSAAALSEALMRILDDQTLRCELVARGKVRAKSFTWDACAQSHVTLYRSLVGHEIE